MWLFSNVLFLIFTHSEENIPVSDKDAKRNTTTFSSSASQAFLAHGMGRSTSGEELVFKPCGFAVWLLWLNCERPVS